MTMEVGWPGMGSQFWKTLNGEIGEPGKDRGKIGTRFNRRQLSDPEITLG
jgi:hypothetical protein